jgi:hypothetical protein
LPLDLDEMFPSKQCTGWVSSPPDAQRATTENSKADAFSIRELLLNLESALL